MARPIETPEAAYETTFHELTHWSEHVSRLNWNRADEGYGMGELIAENIVTESANKQNATDPQADPAAADPAQEATA